MYNPFTLLLFLLRFSKIMFTLRTIYRFRTRTIPRLILILKKKFVIRNNVLDYENIKELKMKLQNNIESSIIFLFMRLLIEEASMHRDVSCDIWNAARIYINALVVNIRRDNFYAKSNGKNNE